MDTVKLAVCSDGHTILCNALVNPWELQRSDLPLTTATVEEQAPLQAEASPWVQCCPERPRENQEIHLSLSSEVQGSNAYSISWEQRSWSAFSCVISTWISTGHKAWIDYINPPVIWFGRTFESWRICVCLPFYLQVFFTIKIREYLPLYPLT